MRSRDRLRLRYIELLAEPGRWDEILEVDAGNEGATVALMQRALRNGDRRWVLERFDELEQVLRNELGLRPGQAATGLRDEAAADPTPVDAPTTGMRTFLKTDIEAFHTLLGGRCRSDERQVDSP